MTVALGRAKFLRELETVTLTGRSDRIATLRKEVNRRTFAAGVLATAAVTPAAVDLVVRRVDGRSPSSANISKLQDVGGPIVVNPTGGYVGSIFEAQGGGVRRLSVDNNGVVNVTGKILFDPPGTANQIQLEGVAGVHGRRLSIEAAGPSGSAEVQLLPANTAPNGLLNAQIQWIGVAGTNLERLAITAVSNSYVIDTTSNGTGVPRTIFFQAQGTSGSVANQNALAIYGDASVDLNGAAFTDGNGVSFGSTRTRIADWTNTGQSYLIFDTRTGTPANNTADATGMRFRRGGAEKWLVGLNVAGDNSDSFGFRFGGSTRLKLTQAGHLVSAGSAPTLGALQANVSAQNITTIAATDTRGIVSITAGATPPGAGSVVAVLTFAAAYATEPVIVLVNRGGQTTALPWSVYNPSATDFSIVAPVALTANATYLIEYLVIG